MKHKIVFFKDKICLWGEIIPHLRHKHYYIQITISCVDNRYYMEICDSNYSHNLKSGRGHYFSILLDPESLRGSSVKEYLSGRGNLVKEHNNLGYLFDFDNFKLRDIEKRVENILNSVGLKPDPPGVDERVQRVVEGLKVDCNHSFSAFCDELNISESQLHLIFKRDLGITFRGYSQFLKLKEAIKAVLSGESFTDAAYIGGFSDSSHLARIFKRNTGLSMKKLFRNKRFVQVLSIA